MKRQFIIFGLVIGLLLSAQNTFGQFIYDTIYGQITTPTGAGVPNVHVNALTGTCGGFSGASTLTSSFGYYSLYIPFDCTIIIQPINKKYTFTPNVRILNFGAYEPVNFTAEAN